LNNESVKFRILCGFSIRSAVSSYIDLQSFPEQKITFPDLHDGVWETPVLSYYQREWIFMPSKNSMKMIKKFNQYFFIKYDYLNDGPPSEYGNCKKRTIEVTKRLVLNLRRALRRWQCVLAIYEAPQKNRYLDLLFIFTTTAV
jgi:hypothetical protein